MRIFSIAIVVVGLAFVAACTKHHVQLEAKEPIVIKVEARIDIYNHAAEIEDMVSGKQPIDVLEEEEQDRSFFFRDPFSSSAYAAGNRALRKAVAQRKARYSRIQEIEQRGIAGEGINGYLEIRSRATLGQKALVKRENEDRKIIYVETAREKGVPVAEVQKGFSEVLRKRAGPGTWIETPRGWVRK